jgi:hypothetical protein
VNGRRSFQNERAALTQAKITKRAWHHDVHFYFSDSRFIGAFSNIEFVSCRKPQPSPEYPSQGLFQPEGFTDAINKALGHSSLMKGYHGQPLRPTFLRKRAESRHTSTEAN